MSIEWTDEELQAVEDYWMGPGSFAQPREVHQRGILDALAPFVAAREKAAEQRGADQKMDEPVFTCKRCGSHEWVAASLNGGVTRIAQCVPCGRYSADPVEPLERVRKAQLVPLREQSRRLTMMRRARNFLARQVVRDAAVIKELQLALEGKERETQELFNLARRGEFSEGNHYWLRCARCGGAWGRGSDHPDTQCDLMRGLVIVDDTDALRRDVMKALATPGFAYQLDGRAWITGYADSLADVVIKELRGKAQDPQPGRPLPDNDGPDTEQGRRVGALAGIPIVVDDSIPRNEAHLRSGDATLAVIGMRPEVDYQRRGIVGALLTSPLIRDDLTKSEIRELAEEIVTWMEWARALEQGATA